MHVLRPPQTDTHRSKHGTVRQTFRIMGEKACGKSLGLIWEISQVLVTRAHENPEHEWPFISIAEVNDCTDCSAFNACQSHFSIIILERQVLTSLQTHFFNACGKSRLSHES